MLNQIFLTLFAKKIKEKFNRSKKKTKRKDKKNVCAAAVNSVVEKVKGK